MDTQPEIRTVYRLEHVAKGKGAYSAGAGADSVRLDRIGRARYRNHPPPESDPVIRGRVPVPEGWWPERAKDQPVEALAKAWGLPDTKPLIFGFTSKAQALRWFDEHDQRANARTGVRWHEYHVPAEAILEGATQAIFDRSVARLAAVHTGETFGKGVVRHLPPLPGRRRRRAEG